MGSLFGSAPGVTGANDIARPSSDDDKNRPPQEAAKRIADFVKVGGFGGDLSWEEDLRCQP